MLYSSAVHCTPSPSAFTAAYLADPALQAVQFSGRQSFSTRCGRYMQEVGTSGHLLYLLKYPANTKRSSNVVSMLGQRRKQWRNIETTLGERLVFCGYTPNLPPNTMVF